MGKKSIAISASVAVFLASINAAHVNTSSLMLLAETAIAQSNKEESVVDQGLLLPSLSEAFPVHVEKNIQSSKSEQFRPHLWNRYVQNLRPIEDSNPNPPMQTGFMHPFTRCPDEFARQYVVIGGEVNATSTRDPFYSYLFNDKRISIYKLFTSDCMANLKNRIIAYCFDSFPRADRASIEYAVHEAFKPVTCHQVIPIIEHESTDPREMNDTMLHRFVDDTSEMRAVIQKLMSAQRGVYWEFIAPSIRKVQRMMVSVMKITLLNDEHSYGLKSVLLDPPLTPEEQKEVADIYAKLTIATSKISIKFPQF